MSWPNLIFLEYNQSSQNLLIFHQESLFTLICLHTIWSSKKMVFPELGLHQKLQILVFTGPWSFQILVFRYLCLSRCLSFQIVVFPDLGFSRFLSFQILVFSDFGFHVLVFLEFGLLEDPETFLFSLSLTSWEGSLVGVRPFDRKLILSINS